MNHIQYGILPDGLVVSRLDDKIAWPILEYEKIGLDGDYTKPFEYKLEKLDVINISREWDYIQWTKKIPVPMKNLHREFWGFKPLKENE